MGTVSHDQLRKIPLFRSCTNEELDRLGRCVTRRRLPTEGMILFDHLVASDAAYIIQTGMLIAELPLDGDVSVEMARMGPGTVVGELCLIKPGPRSLRVRCLAPTDLIRIDRKEFEAMREAKDGAAYKLIRNICLTMCDRLRSTNEFIERELRHEAPAQADETRLETDDGLVERAKLYLSALFGREK